MRLTIQLVASLFAGVLAANVWAADLKSVKNLMSEGDYTQARLLLDQALREDPSALQGRFLSGLLFTEAGEIDAAIEVFKALSEDYPALPEPHNNLAVLYAAKGEYVLARDALLVAINTHPSYATAHENLGDIYAKMAGLAYDQALQLDRDNETAKAKLALMHDLVSADEISVTKAATRVATANTPKVEATDGQTAESAVQVVDAAFQREIMSTVDEWANAWSDQDVSRYLDAYGTAFKPQTDHNRDQWERLRQQRLTNPRYIRVSIDNPSIEYSGDRAVVSFMQTYQSDTYGDRVRKQLVLAREGNLWKIVRETTIE